VKAVIPFATISFNGQRIKKEYVEALPLRKTASTRKCLNNVNKLGCAQLRLRFVVVINQQLQFSMVTIDNN
jgi:hypothetical protein